MQETKDQKPSAELPRAGGELYVAGVLVHCVPARATDVRNSISEMSGAIVHGGAEGKLVVTLEAASASALLDPMSQIQALPGVLSALPIYQHNEPADEIDEEGVYGD